MQPYKILNLYACLGGNRYKWDEVAQLAGITIQVTAVELDSELARLYAQRFPQDIVIIADAHKYLLDHYKEFNFIWSSPPCPSHSRARFWNSTLKEGYNSLAAVYPEMELYQEIILCQKFLKIPFCIENVVPYYDTLIPGQTRGRHIYWTNFKLPGILSNRKPPIIRREKNEMKSLCHFHNIDLSTYKGTQRKDKIARNLVDYEAGKTILLTALNITAHNNTKQTSLEFQK